MKPKNDTQKIHREHKKLGKPKKFTKEQLEKLVKHFSVKYAFTLEEVLLDQQNQIFHLRNSNRILHQKLQSDTETLDFQRKTIEDLEKKLEACQKDKYDFSQKDTVLESEKVRHSYTLKPKKNGRGN